VYCVFFDYFIHTRTKVLLLPVFKAFLRIFMFRFIRARTDYANRACNVTCNVMLVAKLVPRTADEQSAQRTASILRSLIDRTPFHRHRDECLCCKKSNSAHNICISLTHTRRINNSTSFRLTATS
jgi:hypothetical protein